MEVKTALTQVLMAANILQNEALGKGTPTENWEIFNNFTL